LRAAGLFPSTGLVAMEHDATTVTASPEAVEAVRKMMDQPFTPSGPPVEFKAELTRSLTWDDVGAADDGQKQPMSYMREPGAPQMPKEAVEHVLAKLPAKVGEPEDRVEEFEELRHTLAHVFTRAETLVAKTVEPLGQTSAAASIPMTARELRDWAKRLRSALAAVNRLADPAYLEVARQRNVGSAPVDDRTPEERELDRVHDATVKAAIDARRKAAERVKAAATPEEKAQALRTYDKMKEATYPLLYSTRPSTMQRVFRDGLPDDGKGILERFVQQFPEIRRWMKSSMAKRRLPPPDDPATLPFHKPPVQGGAADMDLTYLGSANDTVVGWEQKGTGTAQPPVRFIESGPSPQYTNLPSVRGVAVLLAKHDGQSIAIARRLKKTPAELYGLYEGVAGAVEDGETLRDACLRELEEEAGVPRDPSFCPQWRGVVEIHRGTLHTRMALYALRLPESFELRHEVKPDGSPTRTQWEWVALSTARRLARTELTPTLDALLSTVGDVDLTKVLP
jgi:8-oxo-dGTP pyrophosphatase MutT (NUDIX family)